MQQNLEDLEVIFETSNAVQFKSVYFCEIIDSDTNIPSASSGNGDFRVFSESQNIRAKKYNDCYNENDEPITCPENIKGDDRLVLKVEKSSDETFTLDLQEAKKYVFRIRACSGAANLRIVFNCLPNCWK